MTDKTPRDRLSDGLNDAAKNYKGMWSKSDTWSKAHTTLGKGYEDAAKRDGYHRDKNSKAANNTEHNDK